jgi:2-methylcitrate dehydratase PrpD
MTDIPLAQRLARFGAESRYDQLPGEVVSSVRMRVLDVLGICVAATSLDTSRSAREYVAEQGGRQQAWAVGIPEPVPAVYAAFVNGVLAHSLDYDDTHLPSVMHPSATVVPAALAAAQAAGADGRALIAAIAVGLEVAVRLGMAGYSENTGNSLFFEYGQHATSICGAMGGAVSAGLLLGLDADGLTNTLGVAASMASGILEANRTGGTVKRLHCGWAAHASVSAAQLVRHGFTGPSTVLEGRFGFFQAWLRGEFDALAITDGLGIGWTVPEIHFKPYPANHFTHSAIDAAMALHAQGLRPADVASATLGVPAPVVRTIGEPIESKRMPSTGYMAQFSGPYAVAGPLFGGTGLGMGLDDYTDALARDPQRRALMSKVVVVADDRCTKKFPHQFPAVLHAQTYDGRELVAEIFTNRGGPERPLTFDELATKYRDNALRWLPEIVVNDLQRRVAHLDEEPDIGSLLAPLRRVGLPGSTGA